MDHSSYCIELKMKGMGSVKCHQIEAGKFGGYCNNLMREDGGFGPER